MLRFTRSRSDRLRFISSVDGAVDMSTPEAVEGYNLYLKDLNVGHLTLTAEPTVFVLRPLTQEIIGIAAQLSRGLVIPGMYLDPQACREMFRLSCESMEPEPEGWDENDIYRFEYRRKVLSHEVVKDLPDGLLREGAQILIDSLPQSEQRASGDESDPFVPTPPAASSGSSSGGKNGSGTSQTVAKSAPRRKGAKRPGTSGN